MAYNTEVLADTPTMYLRLGESSGTNANDQTANNLDGTYTGGVTLAQPGLVGDADKAADFNGTTGYVALPSSSLLSPGAGAFTVEAWVKTDTTAALRQIYVDYGSVTNNLIALWMAAGGSVEGYFRDGAGNAVYVGPTAAISTGTRYHVVLTRSGGTVRVFVNGVEMAGVSGTLGTVAVGDGTAPTVGAADNLAGGHTTFWDGIIDEVAVYQLALSPTRVLAHFNAATGVANVGAPVPGRVPIRPGPAPTPGLLVTQATDRMLAATNFWRANIGYNGAYRTALYTQPAYSEKNAKALVFDTNESQGHAQQGEVFLAAWLATGNTAHRDAAIEAGQALADSMVLQSSGGGWSVTEAWVPGHAFYSYPHRRDDPGPYEGWRLDWSESFYWGGWSIQGTDYLIRLDKALNGSNATIHDACLDSVAGLLQAELPNHSGWPGRVFKSGATFYGGASGVRELTWSTANASFPTWANGTPLNMPAWDGLTVPYWDYKHSQYPFLNDFTHRYIMHSLFEAYRWLGTTQILNAINNLAAYIRRAQMPAPQRGWCQSYDQNVRPKWGRTMEPPALCCRETGETIRMLLEHYLFVGTGNVAHGGQASLDAAIAGSAWLASVKGVAGNANLWHMFKELVTGNPLYKRSDGGWQITKPASEWPGYGFEIADSLDYIPGLISEIQTLGRTGWITTYFPETATPAAFQAAAAAAEPQVQTILSETWWAASGFNASPWDFVTKMRFLARYVFFNNQAVYPWVNHSTVSNYHSNMYPHHFTPIVVP